MAVSARSISAEDVSRAISRAMDAAVDLAGETADATKAYMASEQGRRLRRGLAGAVIVGAPLFARLPVLRRTPMARLLRTAAVATLVVKGAEWIRDWEPSEAPA